MFASLGFFSMLAEESYPCNRPQLQLHGRHPSAHWARGGKSVLMANVQVSGLVVETAALVEDQTGRMGRRMLKRST